VDVAAYVAEFAGVPGVEPPIPADAGPGAEVFLSQGCGSCHTLAELGDIATGTVGPDLDEVIPGQSPAQVEKSIVDPDAEIAQGFPSGVMPDNYGEELSPKELSDLADFLVESAGTGAGN
jgi:mono/diheme cytochrome c family protein